MLGKRVLTALWGIPLVIAVIWFDTPLPWFTVFAAVWGALAAFEFYRLVNVSHAVSLTVFGIIGTVLFILHPHLGYEFIVPILLAALVGLSLILLVFLPREGVFTVWAWTLVGVLYIGWLLSFLVDLRLNAGRDWVFLALFATFGSDILAYFVGRLIGRHKMAPNISPGKTWEGAAGGLAGGILVCLFFTLDTPLQLPLNIWQAVLLGVLVSVFGQLGDLAESRLKRWVGAKESGRLMPGHGGLLDRMDSVVLAGVVVYLYYYFVVAP